MVLGNHESFHVCMTFVVCPLEIVRLTGMPIFMGDGTGCNGYLICAAHVGDYPEQILVIYMKSGKCPICAIPHNQSGDPAATCAPHKMGPVLAALNTLHLVEPGQYKLACLAAGIKPVQQLYWKNLLFLNIFWAITPDILHQLFQGIIQHLILWLCSLLGDEEIDKCYK